MSQVAYLEYSCFQRILKDQFASLCRNMRTLETSQASFFPYKKLSITVGSDNNLKFQLFCIELTMYKASDKILIAFDEFKSFVLNTLLQKCGYDEQKILVACDKMRECIYQSEDRLPLT